MKPANLLMIIVVIFVGIMVFISIPSEVYKGASNFIFHTTIGLIISIVFLFIFVIAFGYIFFFIQLPSVFDKKKLTALRTKTNERRK